MGWDGYACRVKFDDFYKENLLERLTDAEGAELGFASTSDSSETSALRPDFHMGSRAYARVLAQATGEQPYASEWWPAQVRELAQRANWNFEVAEDDVECKRLAQMFLTLCAEHNLGVRFD